MIKHVFLQFITKTDHEINMDVSIGNRKLLLLKV